MATLRITAKRQATLPRALCDELGVRPGDDLQTERRVVKGETVWVLGMGRPHVRACTGQLLPGCTITQTARPVSLPEGDAKAICVVENPRVDETFLPAFTGALKRRGFSVQLLPPESASTSCPLTATYYARWSWDFVPYMSHAKVVVYRDGSEAGDALYDAPKAGTALTTKIYDSTDYKVATMVDRLFPRP